jgi:hypothetical protein
MNRDAFFVLKPVVNTAAVLLSACFSPWAHAADHALIMGVGTYANAGANLPGIDKDVAIARRIASSMGVPASNIRELTDGQVTAAGVRQAFDDLEASIRQGDRVFVYYSGHGAQEPSASGGARCTEGMYVHDMRLYRDVDLEQSLMKISRKAGQLVMFNDSCFSGGAATKAVGPINAVPKLYKAVAQQSNYTCGDAINTKSAMRNLISAASKAGNNMVYVAASADNEVAFATREGSSATLAWESCLRAPEADANRSGTLTADELRVCAQSAVKRMGFNQTITVEGNRQLPMSFAASSARQDSGSAAARRNAATLEDIRQSASSSIQVELRAARQELTINKDALDFSVRTSRAGYLYVLHIGSDGKTFDLLFPNDRDSNNYVQAGTVNMPRPSWSVMAGGPVGESYLMAIVSETPRDYGAMMRERMGPFRATEADPDGQKNLFTVSTNAGRAGSGQFGASSVVPIRERN